MIRDAKTDDAQALGSMGAALARLHHQFDPQRFMLPDGLEEGYASWLTKELKDRKKAVVIVAEREGTVVGYAYGRVEPRNWNKLLDRHAELVDLWVDEAHRGNGLGGQLAEAAFQKLSALGVPRVVLMSAARNEAAQKIFAKLGWRATMLEMTRES